MKKTLVIGLLVLALSLLPQLVSAHAIPMACLPRMGINLSKVPDEVICQFSEPLVPSNISMIVLNASGERVDKNDTRFWENDDHTLVVSLDTARMSAGIYTVQWQVTDTVDAGATSGTFQFGVNTVVPPTPTAVLPGVAMTPTPTQPTGNPGTDLISRFLIGVGIAVLAAVGILFWRMRKSQAIDQE